MDTQDKYDALLAQWGYDGTEFKYTKKAYAVIVKISKTAIQWLVKARASATENTVTNRFTTQF
ncbi:hypothetical protein O1D97_11775 [Marinomonas sp. 15G1-11]|uniref:Uncharacterized protein n=1 Tax=Marinomonas phaeophyticola TaxID=3004091 RepID=A0ABT4JV65_9GAMM|nr:hypothetical protein [Marinomonas sp. 15G1-11]MCZ2722288.1 hypothetical protein [Marinomonas sp. 15G1-11]